MPELPEVETVARGLRQAILGRRILSVTLGKTDFIDDPAALEQHLPGRRIEAVERYGKFMLLRLSAAHGKTRAETNGDAAPASLLVHLGMTGQIAPSPAGLPREKHTHVCLLLDDGRELRYTDARRFGRIAYLAEAPLAQELVGFGADPLEVTKEEFAKRCCWTRACCAASAISMPMRAYGGRGSIQRGWEPSLAGNKRRHCAAHCETFCKKRLFCAGPRFPIFLTRKASRENISGTIARTDAKEKTAAVARRRFGA